MDYKRALVAARNGNAVIFFGAGYSCEAQSLSGGALPTGGQLAALLCEDVSAEATNDLKIGVRRYLKLKSPTDLITRLKSIFTTKSVSEAHKIIANIPWRAIHNKL